jgi:hypothetical protein
MALKMREESSSIQTQPRVAQPDDWKISSFVNSLAEILGTSGINGADKSSVFRMMDGIKAGKTSQEGMKAITDLVGERWTAGTVAFIYNKIKDIPKMGIRLPGSKEPDIAAESLNLFKNLLKSAENSEFSTKESAEKRVKDLVNVGYSENVASKITASYPKLSDDIILWTNAMPEKAKPAVLYRALGLEGGWKGYDSSVFGNCNGEVYFDQSKKTAMSFGGPKADFKGLTPVIIELQIPGFMLESSPPQGWDASYPILRERNMPNPEKPDLLTFINKIGEFETKTEEIKWLDSDITLKQPFGNYQAEP